MAKDVAKKKKSTKQLRTFEECSDYYDRIPYYLGIFTLPYIPPTTNKVYFNLPSGGRAKTTPTNIFINNVNIHLTNEYLTEINMINPNSIYELQIMVHFSTEELFTKGYPNAISAYRKKDVDNRIKVLKDTFIKWTGIKDDSQVFNGSCSKITNPIWTGVEVMLKEVSPIPYLLKSITESPTEGLKYLNNCIDFRENGIRN